MKEGKMQTNAEHNNKPLFLRLRHIGRIVWSIKVSASAIIVASKKRSKKMVDGERY
jgi:hypothetical protein